MAELICPHCGNPNPDDLEQCQFCGSPLLPGEGANPAPGPDDNVDSSAEESASVLPPVPGSAPETVGRFEKVHLPMHGGKSSSIQVGPQDLSEDLPGDLDENSQELPQESPEESLEERPEESPDWLSGLESAGSQEEQLPDWLKNLGGDQIGIIEEPQESGEPFVSPPGEESPAPEGPEQEGPEQEGPEQEGPGQESPVQEEQLPDWLNKLGGDQIGAFEEPQEPEEPVVSPPGDEPSASKIPSEPAEPQIPSSELQEPAPEGPVQESPEHEGPVQESPEQERSVQEEQPESQAGAPAFEDEEPDWLKILQARVPEVTEEPPASPEELPDWLTDLPPASDEESSADLSLQGDQLAESHPDEPDWLSQLRPRSSGEGPTGEIPDWLKVDQTSSETSTEPEEEPVPDWLSSESEFSKPPESSESDTDLPSEEPIPDWLSSESELSGPSEPPEPFGSESTQPSEEQLPDWLESGNELSEPPESSESEPTRPSEESLPDWLIGGSENSETAEPSESSTLTSPENAVPPDEEPSSDTSSGSSEGVTGSQTDGEVARQESGEPGDLEPASDEISAEKAEEPIPDWLSRIEPGSDTPDGSTPALVTGDQESVSPETPAEPFSVDIPEWLSSITPETESETPDEELDTESDSESESDTGHGPLEAAELPSWVQAMRPIESVVETKTAGFDDSVTETSGPLAGLHGVLPVMPVGPKRKPHSYSSSIHVSEGQQRYASYLEKLVGEEMHPRPVRKTHITSNQVLRWILTLVLFLAIGLPLVFSGGQVYPTLLEPSDQFASASVVDGLSANLPVLVAFDYDPALAGEMETVAAPLMDRLLARHLPLVLVSTSPTGPVLAQHFLNNAPLVNQYGSGAGRVVNLGYLPGGPAGLLSFSENPTVSMPFTVGGAFAWANPPFSGVQGLADFGAVLVITDNADTGRDWVEQVAPRLGGTPMLMLISAQAEPMLRPYFDSGQIKGFVSGLSDAKIYEQKFNRPGQAYHFWPAFKVGMLIAEILIVVGAAYALWSDWRTRSKESRGAA